MPVPSAPVAPDVRPLAATALPTPETRPQRRREAVAPVPRHAIPELPPVTLELPPDSGLVLVETSHRAATAPDDEAPMPAGPRRARRPRVQVAEEPLQIVETRKGAPPAS
jgi:hypothetical protein